MFMHTRTRSFLNNILPLPLYPLLSCIPHSQVAVALMRSFQPQPWEPDATARWFAKSLQDSWGVGHAACNDGVLFLLSVDDRQMYVSAGAGTLDHLTDRVLTTILDGLKPLLKAGQYDVAVEKAVSELGQALATMPSKPSAWEDLSGYLFLGGFLSLFGGLFYWSARNSHRQQQAYKSCRTRLEELKKLQERLQAGESFNPTSCPICLEDYDPPTAGGGHGGPPQVS